MINEQLWSTVSQNANERQTISKRLIAPQVPSVNGEQDPLQSHFDEDKQNLQAVASGSDALLQSREKGPVTKTAHDVEGQRDTISLPSNTEHQTLKQTWQYGRDQSKKVHPRLLSKTSGRALRKPKKLHGDTLAKDLFAEAHTAGHMIEKDVGGHHYFLFPSGFHRSIPSDMAVRHRKYLDGHLKKLAFSSQIPDSGKVIKLSEAIRTIKIRESKELTDKKRKEEKERYHRNKARFSRAQVDRALAATSASTSTPASSTSTPVPVPALAPFLAPALLPASAPVQSHNNVPESIANQSRRSLPLEHDGAHHDVTQESWFRDLLHHEEIEPRPPAPTSPFVQLDSSLPVVFPDFDRHAESVPTVSTLAQLGNDNAQSHHRNLRLGSASTYPDDRKELRRIDLPLDRKVDFHDSCFDRPPYFKYHYQPIVPAIHSGLAHRVPSPGLLQRLNSESIKGIEEEQKAPPFVNDDAQVQHCSSWQPKKPNDPAPAQRSSRRQQRRWRRCTQHCALAQRPALHRALYEKARHEDSIAYVDIDGTRYFVTAENGIVTIPAELAKRKASMVEVYIGHYQLGNEQRRTANFRQSAYRLKRDDKRRQASKRSIFRLRRLSQKDDMRFLLSRSNFEGDDVANAEKSAL